VEKHHQELQDRQFNALVQQETRLYMQEQQKSIADIREELDPELDEAQQVTALCNGSLQRLSDELDEAQQVVHFMLAHSLTSACIHSLPSLIIAFMHCYR
jgi:hypothetical protein